MGDQALFTYIVEGLKERPKYALTLAAVSSRWVTSAEVAEIRGVSQKVAAADLIRCVRWGLLSRSPSRPFQYAPTKRGKQRLEWLCNPKSPEHKPNRYAKPGKLDYRQFVQKIFEGLSSTTEIAGILGIPVKHASASATRVWKMGLTQRKQSGRRFVYSLSAKGLRLVEGVADFSGDVMQYQQDGYTRLPRGETASGNIVVLMGKFHDDAGPGDRRMEFEIHSVSDGPVEPIVLLSNSRYFKGVVRVDSPELDQGEYHWRARYIVGDAPGPWIQFTDDSVAECPDFVVT